MRKADALKQRARDMAEAKGHVLSKFKQISEDAGGQHEAVCHHCKAYIRASLEPTTTFLRFAGTALDQCKGIV